MREEASEIESQTKRILSTFFLLFNDINIFSVRDDGHFKIMVDDRYRVMKNKIKNSSITFLEMFAVVVGIPLTYTYV